jgi:hypothetical protein
MESRILLCIRSRKCLVLLPDQAVELLLPNRCVRVKVTVAGPDGGRRIATQPYCQG